MIDPIQDHICGSGEEGLEPDSGKIITCAHRVVTKIKYYELYFKLHRGVQMLIMSVILTRS